MVAIIGGGITGLVLGVHLKRAKIPFRILEATDRVGGNIQTIQEGPYLLEKGPNTLQLNNEIYEILQELRLVEQLEYAREGAKYRFILKEGKYERLPSGPLSLMTSRVFSGATKRRVMKEPKIPPSNDTEESLDQFFRRRLGDEITDYVVYPFVSGIYAGDPAALLVREAFPQLSTWEHTYGSIIKGFTQSRKRPRRKGIVSFGKGLSELTEALHTYLKKQITLEAEVERIHHDGKFIITTNKGEFEAPRVVCTVPAYRMAAWQDTWETGFEKALKQIHYPSLNVVYTAYSRENVTHPLNGFGALHNHKEPTHSLGTIFSSSLFDGRCPGKEVLFTTFVGGALQPKLAQADDASLTAGVCKDLEKFLGASGTPTFQQVIRWPQSIPQYDTNIRDYQTYQDELAGAGLLLGGNWVGGISVGACFQQAKKLFQQLVETPAVPTK